MPDGFQWNAANRGEERNPVNVLGFDGVRIGLDGRADPAQRLDLGDLRSLVERSAP